MNEDWKRFAAAALPATIAMFSESDKTNCIAMATSLAGEIADAMMATQQAQLQAEKKAQEVEFICKLLSIEGFVPPYATEEEILARVSQLVQDAPK